VLASADAAEGVGAMPAELELALICQHWGSLPEAGGILDQPVGLLKKMTTVLNIYNAVISEKQRGNMSLVEWSKSNPAAYKTIIRIERLRET